MTRGPCWAGAWACTQTHPDGFRKVSENWKKQHRGLSNTSPCPRKHGPDTRMSGNRPKLAVQPPEIRKTEREGCPMSVDPADLVSVDHPMHPNMYKTLDLLSLQTAQGPVYFVVEGCAELAPDDEVAVHKRFYYEENSCPTNFIPVEAIVVDGDDDRHGLFTFVATAWMKSAYLEALGVGNEFEYLKRIFPVLA